MKFLNQLKEFWQNQTPLVRGIINATIIIIIIAVLCYLTVIFWNEIKILLIIFPFIIFFPAILPLYFIFKKTPKTSWRIFWVAFLIPFLNFIYYVFEFIFTYPFDDPTHHPIMNSTIIGLMMIYYSPIILVVVSCIPEKKLKIKWQIVKTILLMLIIGLFVFVPLTLFVDHQIYLYMTK